MFPNISSADWGQSFAQESHANSLGSVEQTERRRATSAIEFWRHGVGGQRGCRRDGAGKDFADVMVGFTGGRHCVHETAGSSAVPSTGYPAGLSYTEPSLAHKCVTWTVPCLCSMGALHAHASPNKSVRRIPFHLWCLHSVSHPSTTTILGVFWAVSSGTCLNLSADVSNCIDYCSPPSINVRLKVETPMTDNLSISA